MQFDLVAFPWRRLVWPLRMAAALVAAVMAAASPALAYARSQQAPSSRIVLDLPDGFEPATLFSGFNNEAQGISVIVVEFPEKAFAELEASMTPEALAAKGIDRAKRGKLQRTDAHIYMQAEQTSQAGKFAKFFVVFRERAVTALITANVQMASLEKGTVTAADIEKVLATARVTDVAAPAAELFKLGYLGPFKPAGQLLGTARMFTVDGNSGPTEKAAGKPMVVVAPSLDHRWISQPHAYAEGLIQGLPGLTETRIIERRLITVGDLDGVEMIGVAKDRESGVEVAIYQALLLTKPGGYFRVFGQVATDKSVQFLPEFRRIAEGFKLAP